MVERLVARGANVGLVDDKAVAPVWATLDGVDVVEFLLEHGANIQTPPPGGEDDPVSYAASNGNIDVLRVLIKGDVDLEKQNSVSVCRVRVRSVI